MFYCMCKLFDFNIKCIKYFDCNYIEGFDNRYWLQNLRKIFWNEENEIINLQFYILMQVLYINNVYII